MSGSLQIAKSALKQIDRLTLDGQYHGGDQEWYAEDWHKRAGCGPTTASTLLYYLAQRAPDLQPLWPTAGNRTKEDFTQLMELIWQDVTPGVRGLNRAEMMVEGLERYSFRRAVPLIPHVMHIQEILTKRNDFTCFAEFIQAGLEADCPVAFLNLSNGKVQNLHNWHWVPIVAVEKTSSSWQTVDALSASILDEARFLTVDMKCWYETSWLGGALVWFSRPRSAVPPASPVSGS